MRLRRGLKQGAPRIIQDCSDFVDVCHSISHSKQRGKFTTIEAKAETLLFFNAKANTVACRSARNCIYVTASAARLFLKCYDDRCTGFPPTLLIPPRFTPKPLGAVGGPSAVLYARLLFAPLHFAKCGTRCRH